MISQAISKKGSPLWYQEGFARRFALTSDPRFAKYVAERKAAIAKARADLPVALAREKLSMLPPG
jgi:hypothetical protein